jgi:nucleoside-diphosphate-sugar epimerase
MPSHCLVTGVGGFIGSTLAEALLSRGDTVLGVDAMTDYYARDLKDGNLSSLLGRDGFTFREVDLASAELSPLLDHAAYVFHYAAQPGVRKSWGPEFAGYTENNVLATQRLLEAASGRQLRRFVYASSSSVYGDAVELPVRETTLPHPISPYGVTKLAGEHLCGLYARSAGVPTVSLRYFTVYGPRQRPDMAFSRFIRALLEDREIVIYGDGQQTRDFTYVADAVEAALEAAQVDLSTPSGRVYNIGGGSRVSVNTVIGLLQTMTGKTARINTQPAQPGDARHTYADCSAAAADLGYHPRVTLEAGLEAMVQWSLKAATPARPGR